MNLTVMILLLAGLVISATACVIIQNLLKASIALAVVSVILSVIMFLLDAPLAAVFELSVCSGLITVIFVSAISMTRVRTKEEVSARVRARRRRFRYLPVLLIVLFAGIMIILWPRLSSLSPNFATSGATSGPDVFWNKRQADLLGEVIIILVGVYGVLIFFKESVKK